MHAGYFFAALDSFFHLLTFEFESSPGTQLVVEGLGQVKPATAITYVPGEGRVIPCFGNVCFEPIATARDFSAFLRNKAYLQK